MAQLEDDLIEQQRQLERLRKTLANVVDVATHRLHKDHVTAKLKTKVDAEVMEIRHEELIKVQREHLFEALVNKVDAWALDECRRELANVTQCGIAGLKNQQLQLAQNMVEDRAGVEDLRREQGIQSAMLRSSQSDMEALERHQQALAASLSSKADTSTFEEQRRKVATVEDSTKMLEFAVAESSREQYSALMSVKIDNEVMQKAITEALNRHRSALDSTREELATLSDLEQRFQEFQEQAYSKQEEWMQQKEDAANKIFSGRKDRQDEELVQALAKKADLSWYEQQKALLDATQLSLAEQHKSYEDLQVKLMEKVDNPTLERTQERLLLEIAQARQETSDVSCRLDRHQHHLDLARAQLIEIIRQQGELEASLSEKAEQASLESKQWQSDTLSMKLEDVERRQDEARQEFTQLQEQFFAALRGRSSVGDGLCLPKRIMEPPPSPRERLVAIKPSSARKKYNRCEASPALSARRKMGGN